MAGLIEIEIAQRFFDRPVFSLLQAFGKFSRQQIFFRFFCFHRRTEFRLDRVHLLPQQSSRIAQINRRRRPRRSDVRQYRANFAVNRQFRLAAGAIQFESVR